MGFEHDEAVGEELLRAIEAFAPDVTLMGCGGPKSEVWMDRHRERLGRGIGISVGAGVYFLTGRQRRAPRWMQRAGLEWAWRLAGDPARLWRRYLVDDIQFFPLVWRWKHGNRR
jgi:N-acetylglucosaminyldiphosphoundecaprenol N-acetyl-beta-D-mannosaminyltransferase